MCKEPAIRAPAKGLDSPYLLCKDINPGISETRHGGRQNRLIGIYMKNSNGLCFYARETHYFCPRLAMVADKADFYAQLETSSKKHGLNAIVGMSLCTIQYIYLFFIVIHRLRVEFRFQAILACSRTGLPNTILLTELSTGWRSSVPV